MVTTTERIPGKEYEILGLVKGNMIQSKNIGKDIGQGLKSIVGGELKWYTQMMSEARDKATQRMVEEAQAMGADAVVSVRYTTSSVMQGAAEILAFGTAVKFV
ncbi:MAG: YbjQ family protein [Candidatus Methanomethylophilaceae archaeon]|nr:YbjQ family protein [Candidatus Methanomethylophilaceae archaeon]